MNILTIPYGSNLHYIRPDISCNKDWNDYFCPDYIEEIVAVPFIYIRIEKAGKAISSKFAQRYYQTIGYGIHLIATSLIRPDNPASWWLANSLDNTTYFSPLVPVGQTQTIIDTLSPREQECPQGETIRQTIEQIDFSIEKVSGYSSLRTGDLIALELPYANTYLTKPGQPGLQIALGEIHFKIIT